MNKEDIATNLLSIVDEQQSLVLGTFYLYDDEAAAILSLIEIFKSRRAKEQAQ